MSGSRWPLQVNRSSRPSRSKSKKNRPNLSTMLLRPASPSIKATSENKSLFRSSRRSRVKGTLRAGESAGRAKSPAAAQKCELLHEIDLRRPGHIIAHEQVELAVVIVIEEGGRAWEGDRLFTLDELAEQFRQGDARAQVARGC